MSKRRYPPIGCLIPFEAAARLGSMSAAARELGISQPAISRHLQLLEADLGQALFHRNRRGLSLTAAGRDYRDAVTLGLENIARATEILRAGGDQTIRIAANFGFAQQWLMPRFSRLRASYPALFFRLLTSDQDDELTLANSDLAIRFGTGDWPGWHSVQLFQEEVFPICSPAYVGERPHLHKAGIAAGDLLGERLLHMDEVNARWLTWANWLRLQGLKPPAAKPQLLYSTYPLLLQATLAGEGIALGWRGLVDPLLQSGSLVQLLPGLHRPEHGYFVTYRIGHSAEKLLREIVDWLLSEMPREPSP
ncbi:LysR substrate-binding domain-containing protein [Dongia soli]|uniref:LysR substrate-binding domain-containing protein n=1 Tax=Dongia soli TaxID=600628 RepID=A0ABU5EIB0_9PROT|nr:LysR substrate-binding domain-containing protein [Dongia soli]MDY0885592.1 LysR substrate-binding domain-containing protein [Dongia soli]